MKYKHYSTGTFSHIGNTEYYQRLNELSDKCEKGCMFKFEGRFFAGDITNTIKQYLIENPSKSFYVWLIDNGLEITQNGTN
jgi:hypothetical protein